MKWWEKGIQPNMKEITSAQELVDSLSRAGDKLVIVYFFSPGSTGEQMVVSVASAALMPLLGPAKGLEKSELLALAANKDLCFNYTKMEEPLLTAPEVRKPVSDFLPLKSFHFL
ncbi:Thioredoxin-like 1-2, chloroplastic [Dendrobium catenatum]|uniref:Thioredoxin-like 1-2, chloroplastic n=1 Tax=Dendrobium catenatum TaxID=906689 RepID=A0A2I0W0Y3_9ASPA|nr:Thioredoxin-like 1-2, chloroplastic [Dendrobium catenatum]